MRPCVLLLLLFLLLGLLASSLPPCRRTWAQECVRLFQRDVAAAQAAAAAAGGGEPAAAAEVAKMLESNVRYAVAHRDVVARWGRFPQRNAALGRPPASPEEAEALAAGTIPKF